jgi:DtxR family Mn-dependent transcriptional regulator
MGLVQSLAFLDPATALAAGGLLMFLASLLFWPRGGLVGYWQRGRRLVARVRLEDALKHIYTTELSGHLASLLSMAGALQVTLDRAAEVVENLQERGLLASTTPEMHLSVEGRSYALGVIRAHRLWEQHLAERTGVAESEWHRRAERQEHFITPEEANGLAARLGHPTHDPHGDPIPTAGGEMVDGGARELSSLVRREAGRIVHIEDEPEAVYAQIMAEGLYPGLVVRMLECTPQRIRFWANGEEHVLAPIVAGNVSVLPLTIEEAEELPEGQRLSGLARGARARVVRLSPRCRGSERRRLMDLGLLPGTVVMAELESPSGNCRAYRVWDALIALRREQGDMIQVVVDRRSGDANRRSNE